MALSPNEASVHATEGACVFGFNASVPCITMYWKAYHPGAPFRRANEEILELLTRFGESRLMGDMEALLALTPEDQSWLSENWIPRAAEAGLRAVALITTAFELEHAPVRLVGERVSETVQLQYFGEREAAEAWLAEAAGQ